MGWVWVVLAGSPWPAPWAVLMAGPFALAGGRMVVRPAGLDGARSHDAGGGAGRPYPGMWDRETKKAGRPAFFVEWNNFSPSGTRS